MHEFKQDDPPDDDLHVPAAGDPAVVSREMRLAALDAEFESWDSMDAQARTAALREVIARKREATPEVMVRIGPVLLRRHAVRFAQMPPECLEPSALLQANQITWENGPSDVDGRSGHRLSIPRTCFERCHRGMVLLYAFKLAMDGLDQLRQRTGGNGVRGQVGRYDLGGHV